MAKNAFLDRLKSRREGSADSRVRFFLIDQEFSLDDGVVTNSLVRKALKAEAKRKEKQFGGGKYTHPETGERPEIHMVLSDPKNPQISVRLVTDSPILREWLNRQGIVIGEVVKPGAEQPAE